MILKTVDRARLAAKMYKISLHDIAQGNADMSMKAKLGQSQQQSKQFVPAAPAHQGPAQREQAPAAPTK